MKDISWLAPTGEEMSDEAWNAGFVQCLGVRLAGDLINDMDERGEPIVDDTILLLLNAHHDSIPFVMPKTKGNVRWERLLDTADAHTEPMVLEPGWQYPLEGRSLAVLRTQPRSEEAKAGS